MTREKAIVLIECSLNDLKEALKEITMTSSASKQLRMYIDAYDMAVSVLRQQGTVTNCNELLTLDELWKIDGEFEEIQTWD